MKNSKKSNILPNIPAFCASVCGQLHLPLFVDIETTGFSGARNRLWCLTVELKKNLCRPHQTCIFLSNFLFYYIVFYSNI